MALVVIERTPALRSSMSMNTIYIPTNPAFTSETNATRATLPKTVNHKKHSFPSFGIYFRSLQNRIDRTYKNRHNFHSIYTGQIHGQNELRNDGQACTRGLGISPSKRGPSHLGLMRLPPSLRKQRPMGRVIAIPAGTLPKDLAHALSISASEVCFRTLCPVIFQVNLFFFSWGKYCSFTVHEIQLCVSSPSCTVFGLLVQQEVYAER